MLQAWMLQDAPNHRGTERRGYGVGGNAKGPAVQPMAEQRAHRLWQRRERDRARRTLQSSERRERELQRMHATSHDRLTAETGEEREARLQKMRDCCYVCS